MDGSTCILPCNQCGQKLRIPTNRGKLQDSNSTLSVVGWRIIPTSRRRLQVRCPSCGYSFIFEPGVAISREPLEPTDEVGRKQCHGKAESLMSLANILAISSWEIYNQFPLLTNIVRDDRHLVFLLTVAGVAAGVMLDDENTPKVEQREFAYAIGEKLMKWDYNGYNPYGEGGAYRAYADLANFVKSRRNEGLNSFLAMGFWLIFNLKGSQPDDEEAKVGAIIGQFLAASFSGWWNKA